MQIPFFAQQRRPATIENIISLIKRLAFYYYLSRFQCDAVTPTGVCRMALHSPAARVLLLKAETRSTLRAWILWSKLTNDGTNLAAWQKKPKPTKSRKYKHFTGPEFADRTQKKGGHGVPALSIPSF